MDKVLRKTASNRPGLALPWSPALALWVFHAGSRVGCRVGGGLSPGNGSGVLSTPVPPTATQATCASRSASTCAPMPVPERVDRHGFVGHCLRYGARRVARRSLAFGRPQGAGFWVTALIAPRACRCPTGIDIRNGLQNECIVCAACIDVCDDVMGKMGYAKGLIRYTRATPWRSRWVGARWCAVASGGRAC